VTISCSAGMCCSWNSWWSLTCTPGHVQLVLCCQFLISFLKVLFSGRQVHQQERSRLWDRSQVSLPQAAGHVTSWLTYFYVSLFITDVDIVLRFYYARVSKRYLWCWIIVCKLDQSLSLFVHIMLMKNGSGNLLKFNCSSWKFLYNRSMIDNWQE